jgi:hypothetical protein
MPATNDSRFPRHIERQLNFFATHLLDLSRHTEDYPQEAIRMTNQLVIVRRVPGCRKNPYACPDFLSAFIRLDYSESKSICAGILAKLVT